MGHFVTTSSSINSHSFLTLCPKTAHLIPSRLSAHPKPCPAFPLSLTNNLLRKHTVTRSHAHFLVLAALNLGPEELCTEDETIQDQSSLHYDDDPSSVRPTEDETIKDESSLHYDDGPSSAGPERVMLGSREWQAGDIADVHVDASSACSRMVIMTAFESQADEETTGVTTRAQEERTLKKKNQQLAYLFAALASSVGITFLAAASVYYRFAWQMEGGEVPWTEMFGTFSLALGAAVGMEYWARWAHRALWHASLWNMHESHHQPRDGPFELNDVFAIINAIPAIALMAFGFLHKGLIPGLCFGAGLGITVFGIAYMFVHDGLVHRRFPVGPIADVPYFQKVAAAHQLHHADKFNGVPYGLFLGPKELEEVGGQTELEKVLQKRK